MKPSRLRSPSRRSEKRKRRLCVAGAVAILPSLLALFGACKHTGDDDEDTKPLPSATTAPAESPLSTTTVSTLQEDAGPPPTDAATSPDAKSTKKAASDPTGMRQCCSDLRQNAKTSPPQFQGAYLLAAAACDGMVKGGAKELARLRGMLLGAGLPATCK